MIENVVVDVDQMGVSWVCGNEMVAKRYLLPRVLVCVLRDRSGVVLIEPCGRDVCNNCVCFNCDGTERFRVKAEGAIGKHTFYIDVYYIASELWVVQYYSNMDVMHRLDEQTGKILNSHVTR